MRKPLTALAVVLAVLSTTKFASATSATVTDKTLEFILQIPALGPSGTLASFKLCDAALADKNPSTPQDKRGCVKRTVKADTDAVLSVMVQSESSEVTAELRTTVSHPGICETGEVGVQVLLDGVVGAASVTAVYDEDPRAPGGETTLVRESEGPVLRSPHATVCA